VTTAPSILYVCEITKASPVYLFYAYVLGQLSFMDLIKFLETFDKKHWIE